MGREVRRVPANWQHPKDSRGEYIPLFDGAKFQKELADWDEGKRHWDKGEVEVGNIDSTAPKVWRKKEGDELEMRFEDWDGSRPVQEEYMPVWPAAVRTHYQMYENTDGTPISPVMRTPEELARWLVDNKASSMGYGTATYEQWLATINKGSAHTMVFELGPGGIIICSGVEGIELTPPKGFDDPKKGL